MTDTSVNTCCKTTPSPSPDGAEAPSPGKPRRFRRKPSPQAISIEEAGDVNSGVLLHQLKYRFMGKDTLSEYDDEQWVAQTGECWCEETGLTAKQYKRALRILKDRKLVEVRHHKVRPHHRSRTTFIRLPTAEAGSATSLGVWEWLNRGENASNKSRVISRIVLFRNSEMPRKERQSVLSLYKGARLLQ